MIPVWDTLAVRQLVKTDKVLASKAVMIILCLEEQGVFCFVFVEEVLHKGGNMYKLHVSEK